MKIRNIIDLRNHAVSTLEKLANNEIEISQAVATGKLCGEIVNTIKVQLEYAKMNQEVPKIEFLGDEKMLLEQKNG